MTAICDCPCPCGMAVDRQGRICEECKTGERCRWMREVFAQRYPKQKYHPILPVNGPVGDSGWKHDNTYHGRRPFDV